VKDAEGGHIQREIPAAFCMRCHELANSPDFDDVKYRPYIVGPGHGQELAKGQQPHPARAVRTMSETGWPTRSTRSSGPAASG